MLGQSCREAVEEFAAQPLADRYVEAALASPQVLGRDPPASVASFTTSTRDIARAYLETRSQREGGEGIVVRNRWGQLERYYDPRGE